jgi:hypothetical protein
MKTRRFASALLLALSSAERGWPFFFLTGKVEYLMIFVYPLVSRIS